MSLNLIKNGMLKFLFATLGYAQSSLRKKSVLLDSLIAIKLSLLKTLRVSFLSLVLANLMKKNILTFIIAMLAYVQGALRKKQLAASFVENFKENHENAICVYFVVVI